MTDQAKDVVVEPLMVPSSRSRCLLKRAWHLRLERRALS
jgi:hypothetical protein